MLGLRRLRHSARFSQDDGRGIPHTTARRMRLALILAAVAVIAVPVAAAAGPPGSNVLPAFCSTTGTVVVTQGVTSVDVAACPIQGRRLVQPLGHGLVGGGVEAPDRATESAMRP